MSNRIIKISLGICVFLFLAEIVSVNWGLATSAGYIINIFYPCENVATNSAPCSLNYDIYALIFLVGAFLILSFLMILVSGKSKIAK